MNAAPVQKKQAYDIPVRRYHQIMMWPLLIRRDDPKENSFRLPQNFLDRITQHLCPHFPGACPIQEAEVPSGPSSALPQNWTWPDWENWQAGRRQVQLGAWYKDEEDYSEIVYFHSFVRDFLYGNGKTPLEERPLRVLRRADVQGLRVALAPDRVFLLDVLRVELYLFETGVAILVVEVSSPRLQQKDGSGPPPLTLKDVLDLQSLIRIAFPRRWQQDGSPSEAPCTVAWQAGNKDLGDVSDYKFKKDFTGIVREKAELPAADHWRFLLKPLPLFGEPLASDGPGGGASNPPAGDSSQIQVPGSTGSEFRFAYQQIQDQRLPSMTYVAVEDPRQITDWDFARLVFYDSAGDSRVGYYSEDFLADWHKTNAYDRFWLGQPVQLEPDPAIPGGIAEHNRDMTTRWLCSGYGFAGVGSTSKFFLGQALANFHHHYFRMGLIAHFHRASLLMLRSQLAEAANLLPKGEPTAENLKDFAEAARLVQLAMMRFRSHFWFREVSTQLQGQEIFSLWSKRLGNPPLFEQVAADITSADQVIRTELSEEETQFVGDLTLIAAGVGVFALVICFWTLVVTLLGLPNALEPGGLWSWGKFADWGVKSVLYFLISLLAVLALGMIILVIGRWARWGWLRKLIKSAVSRKKDSQKMAR